MVVKAFRVVGLTALALALALAGGCSRKEGQTNQQGGGASTRSAAPSAKSEARKRVAVVPKGTVHDFWLTVKAGAEAAGAEEGVEVLWKGPADETDISGQVAIIEDFINQKVDALVMAACDAKGLIPTVKKAVDAGIPVVTIDSGVDSDLPLSFVATDNIAGAREAARTLAKLVGEKGTVGLIPFVPGAATSIMREQGFKEEIAKHPGIKLGPVLYSQSNVERGMQVAEDMLQSHPDLAGIFAANESGAMGAAQALEQRQKAGKVKLVAFDASPSEIEALRRGTIQALIVQNPFRMGHDGVVAAARALRGEKVPKRIDTGVTVVTRENLDDPEIQKVVDPLGKAKRGGR